MLGPTDLPRAVSGVRCMVIEKAPKERSEGGLYLPDTVKERYYAGKLIDAGLQARDTLYDNGYEIGDEVEFGRYAGLREAWDRVTEGDHTLPDKAYQWEFLDSTAGVTRRYRCKKTGAIRSIDSVIVLNVDDLISSIELAARLRRGELKIVRGVTPEGETQHYFERKKT